jgi:phosphoribosylanthranilate isomerase
MLAGGLDEHNVGDAIRRVRPAGVDACTALERRDQSKDLDKCRAFVEAAHAAAAELRASEAGGASEARR